MCTYRASTPVKTLKGSSHQLWSSGEMLHCSQQTAQINWIGTRSIGSGQDQLDRDEINWIRTRSIGSGRDQWDQEREKGHRKSHPKSWQFAGLPESEHPKHLVVLLCLPHIHWPGKQHCHCSLSNAHSVLLTPACETVLHHRRSSHKTNLLLQ